MKPTNTKHLITALLYAALPIVLAFAMPGCTSFFDRAKSRLATTHVDTTYQTVTLTLPRDSAVIRVHTDTTRLIERTRQGRATVTLIREPTFTTVVAECDSAALTRKVIVQTVTQKWGVDPVWQKRSGRWQTATWVLAGLLLTAALAYLLLHKFLLRINLSRR